MTALIPKITTLFSGLLAVRKIIKGIFFFTVVNDVADFRILPKFRDLAPISLGA